MTDARAGADKVRADIVEQAHKEQQSMLERARVEITQEKDKAMAELRNILVSREPLYARASAVVDTAGLSVDAAAARLGEAVAPVLQPEARMFARG